jgi:hypothetical protein
VLKNLEKRQKDMAKLKVVHIQSKPKKKAPAKKQAKKSPAKRKKILSGKKTPAEKLNAGETFRQQIKIMAASSIVSSGKGGNPVKLFCRGRNIPIHRSFRIGRDKVNKVVLANGNAVSRKHAKIKKKEKPVTW